MRAQADAALVVLLVAETLAVHACCARVLKVLLLMRLCNAALALST
jgi:hypothetical protein